jgi:phosphoglycerate dehydrogenase-like enzyme
MGVDQVDIEAATRAGILVTNTPGVATDAVADQALGLLIAVVRDFPRQLREVASGRYQAVFTHDLKALTVGLLGCGRIGGAVARRARAFGMRVIACDPPAHRAQLLPDIVEGVDLAELLAQADIISLHLPLTAESQGIVDASFLRGMKPGSYLVNTARGGLVVETDLLDALQSGHVAGAGLDCLAFEPPEGTSLQLISCPNVIVTPHCSGATVEAKERGGLQAVECVIAALQGKRPQNLVNPEALTAAATD